jgi:lia operon protein LiaI
MTYNKDMGNELQQKGGDKMELNRKSGFALFLIGCGALMVLDKIGFGLGHLFSYIIPLAMLIFGYIGFQGGKKIFGGALMLIGAMILFGKLSGLFGLVLAIILIVYGVSMLKRKRAY